MTNLTAQQKLNLTLVRSADERWRDARRNLEEQVREEVKERSRYLLDARNEATLLAHESGISVTQIAQVGLGTKNTKAARDALAYATYARSARTTSEVAPSRYSRGEEVGDLVITLTGTELFEACRDQFCSVDKARAAGVDTALFRVVAPETGGDVVLVAATESFVAELERPHPVVAWGRAHASEALAWWRESAA